MLRDSHWPVACHYLPAEILPTTVAALVLSRVRYCLPVYGNGSRKNLNKIQKVINFAARVVSGRKKFSRSADVRAALGWLDAEDLFKYHTLALLHKIRVRNTLRVHFNLHQNKQRGTSSVHQAGRRPASAGCQDRGWQAPVLVPRTYVVQHAPVGCTCDVRSTF